MEMLRDFKCEDCGHRFEELVRGKEVPLCPKCKSGKVKRVLAFPGAKAGQRSDWGV
jgi:putative FmdB family regulatory protein